jgi:hypothetical protein
MIEDPERQASPDRRITRDKPDVSESLTTDSLDAVGRPEAGPQGVEGRPGVDQKGKPEVNGDHGWYNAWKRWRWTPSDSAVKVWIVLGGMAALVGGIAAVVAMLIAL